MGQHLPSTTANSKLEDHVFVDKMAEGRSLMLNKITNKQVVTIEHTFPC